MVEAVSVVLSSFIAIVGGMVGFIVGKKHSRETITEISERVLEVAKLQKDPKLHKYQLNKKTLQYELPDTTTAN